jgi:hypothetical protein
LVDFAFGFAFVALVVFFFLGVSSSDGFSGAVSFFFAT